MVKICSLAAGLVLALVAVSPARGETFAADQLRLADTYLRAGNSVAAIAPLLNILRHPNAGAPAEINDAKLRLGEAYVKIGLYGSALHLIEDMSKAPEPWRTRVLALKVELHLRRGDLQEAFGTLRTYGNELTGPLDDGLLFDVARAAFASRATFVTELNLDRLAKDGARPEALFYAGIERLMANDVGQAYQRFDRLAKLVDRTTNPDLFDQVHLALGRLFLENNEPSAASRFYTAIPERSAVFDAALYENAWAYLSEGDEMAAAGNLLRLAIDHPFSPLVPRSQVLYGFLLLRRGEFASAERSFAGYVAHYAALSETIAELNALPRDQALYAEIFDRVDESIASGDDFRIELLTWLQKNPRLARSRELVAALQATEHELSDLARTLREVQSVSEGGPLSMPVAEQRKRETEESEIRDLRYQLQEKSTSAGGRLIGQAQATFTRINRELGEIHALRDELNRVRQRTIDKRRELVSLLQYADIGRWAVWTENGHLYTTPATETTVSNAEADRMFERLDESEWKTLSALQIVAKLERKALQARMELLMARTPHEPLADLLDKQATLLGLESARMEREAAETKVRQQVAASTRQAVRTYIVKIESLRRSLLELSETAVDLRGAVTRTEMQKVEREIGSLLVHARLGNADVAWEARKRARERAREVVRQENQDVESLRSFYQSLGQWDVPVSGASSPRAATSSTIQQANALHEEAAVYAERLDTADVVLAKQREASKRLRERLRAEGHDYDRVARADAAGVLIPAPEPVAGLHFLGSQLLLDGRKVALQESGLLLDSFLQPGSHQIDAALVYMGTDGKVVRFRGSFHFRLESAHAYRIVLAPEEAAEYPHLRFTLANEVTR